MDIDTLIVQYREAYLNALDKVESAWKEANSHTVQDGCTYTEHAQYMEKAQNAEGYKNALYDELQQLYADRAMMVKAKVVVV